MNDPTLHHSLRLQTVGAGFCHDEFALMDGLSHNEFVFKDRLGHDEFVFGICANSKWLHRGSRQTMPGLNQGFKQTSRPSTFHSAMFCNPLFHMFPNHDADKNAAGNRTVTVSCSLCPHNCKIPDGSSGVCGIRKDVGGTLYATSYGRVSSIALDPIEKKPLYMFHPGKHVLSIGGFGCNFHCPFCQNCDISMEYGQEWQNAEYISPEHIVALAAKAVNDGNIGVAYTYNEPLIGYEFLYDCASLVHDAGMLNVVVTNGFINPEPLEKILPYIDAMNINLKAFSDSFYKNLGGSVEAVKKTIKLSQERCHVEITTLVIPGENDSEYEMEELTRWIASLDPEIPLHLTRFFPRYKYSDKAPTPKETIYKLSEIAKRYLKNVFTGNMA